MSNKGFTLVELLAVIVILAIIALIAVPIVVNIINDSKKESLQRSIDLYINHVQKAITKYQMASPGHKLTTCEIVEKGNLTCDGTPIEIEMKGQVPESGTITIVDNKLYYDVVLDGMEYVLDETGKKKPVKYVQLTLATGEDYRGYYADVDEDGKPDGIIYADLKKSDSGQWSNSNGTYSYEAQTGLKEYTISEEKYTEGKFGEKEIISLKKGSGGNSRFYVMALEDFKTPDYSSFYWYRNASTKMNTYASDTSPNFGAGYNNTGKIIGIWNNGESGKYAAAQDNRDIFNHIQEKYNSEEKWYIPSRGEWAAFIDYFTNKTDLETKLTASNYISFGLTNHYWVSSQKSLSNVWRVSFASWRMTDISVGNNYNVRLGVTF